jgi:phosphoglycerate kinase
MLKTLTDLPLQGKKVLMRVDFNVPLDKSGHITDDSRIKATLPSIQYVLDQGGSLILMSHLGRPKGKEAALSLQPCAKRLSELLKKPVQMAPDSIGKDVEEMAHNLQPREILLLENLRFHKGEEKPEQDPIFVKNLAKLGDYYVNDAFGTAHRAHASTAIIADYFKGRSSAGFLLEKELKFLDSCLKDPKRPFYAIIGGAKISTKLGVLKALIKKVDALLIGGAMAYTFFKALGVDIGDSLYEEDLLGEALSILEESKKKQVPLLLPIDLVVANLPVNGAKIQIVNALDGIPSGFQGVDIGPKTIEAITKRVQDGATIFWNGPVGIFEQSDFAKGTLSLAKVLANLPAITIVGGGDSLSAIENAGVGEKITHLSTGGGATLEYIEFGKLPGITPLLS